MSTPENQADLNEFLASFSTTEDGRNYEVPVEGSLGLLALGDVALMAWRLKRKQEAQTSKDDNR